MRSGLLERIDREIENKKAGKPAFIRMKLNSILDEEFIEAFYKASTAGVKVELVVRGICSVRIGIPGLSENITARSILGRFLEHSRIFHFANGGNDELYIGSADLMQRNLDRRVESLVQITQSDHKKYLKDVIDSYLSGDIMRWEMQPDGDWAEITTAEDGTRLKDFHGSVIEWYRAQE
jgi:polyphosphate kinase